MNGRKPEPKYWLSPVPDSCCHCSGPYNRVMYDCYLPLLDSKAWGLFCQGCFKTFKGRLGTGYGQRYDKQYDGQWVKTGG